MKKIAVISPKGGVGKTTTCLSLCQFAASHGLKTVLVDFDNQANATASLVPLDDSLKHHNAYDLVESTGEIIPMEVGPNLWLVPAANQLMQLDREDYEIFFRLRERIEAVFGGYDLVVLDTPGNLGTRVLAAIAAVDGVYVPIELNKYSVQTLEPTAKVIRSIRQRFNPQLIDMGFLPNRVAQIDSIKGVPVLTTEREIYDGLLETFGADMVLGLIGQRRGIKDTMSAGGLINDILADQSGKRAQDELNQFAHAVLKKVGFNIAAVNAA